MTMIADYCQYDCPITFKLGSLEAVISNVVNDPNCMHINWTVMLAGIVYSSDSDKVIVVCMHASI